MSNAFTPQETAEDLARLLRGTRDMHGVSAEELATRSGVRTEDVLEFEAARVVPAEEPFGVYMRALGYDA